MWDHVWEDEIARELVFPYFGCNVEGCPCTKFRGLKGQEQFYGKA